MKKILGTVEYRFSKKFKKGEPNECWPWIGLVSHKGYGVFTIKSKAYAAHRIAYRLAKSDPGDKYVLHRCDNPPCVNPAHLFLGTNDDNMRDMVQKNRTAHAERNGNAIYTDIQVVRMRELFKSGRTQGSIAREFGATQSYVSKIVRGIYRKRLYNIPTPSVAERKCGLCQDDKPCNFENCPEDKK